MAKRKTDQDDFIEEDIDIKTSKRTQKKKALKEESDSDEKPDLELEEPLAKKAKTEEKPAIKKSETSNEDTVKSNSEGEKYVDLGKKKRATVRSFKGIPLLDVREFYGNDGDEKPGKKGISLTLDQWEALKKNADVLDDLITKLPKKT